MSNPLVVNIVSQSAFENLRSEWNDLLARSSSCTVFLTWEWMWTWWEVFGASYRLWLLEILDTSGRRIGLAPLKIARRNYRGLSYRQVEFIGYGPETSPDYLDLIVESGDEQSAVWAIWRFLLEHRQDWDTICLTDTLRPARTLEGFKGLAEEEGYRSRFQSKSICPFVSIEGTWKTYVASWAGKHRYNLASRERKLRAMHQLTFEVVRQNPGLQEAMNVLFDLNKKRWNARGEMSSFEKHALNKTFHRRLADRFGERGWVSVFLLNVDNAPAAVLYVYEFNGHVFHYQSGLETKWSKFGVGQLLIKYVLHKLFVEGWKEFDFLKGVYPYKYTWTARQRETQQLLIWNQGIHPWFLWSVMHYGRKAKALAKSIRLQAQPKNLKRLDEP